MRLYAALNQHSCAFKYWIDRHDKRLKWMAKSGVNQRMYRGRWQNEVRRECRERNWIDLIELNWIAANSIGSRDECWTYLFIVECNQICSNVAQWTRFQCFFRFSVSSPIESKPDFIGDLSFKVWKYHMWSNNIVINYFEKPFAFLSLRKCSTWIILKFSSVGRYSHTHTHAHTHQPKHTHTHTYVWMDNDWKTSGTFNIKQYCEDERERERERDRERDRQITAESNATIYRHQ